MSDSFSLDDDLKLALSLADEADRITTGWLKKTDLEIETKPDRTPVTAADKAVEMMVRERLAIERPGDAILGEEFGESAHAQRRWVIDPIDGTKSFLRHNPLYATLIGLQENKQTLVGVASAPLLDRRWWGASGQGAYVNGERLAVSKVEKVGDAFMSYGSLSWWRKAGLLETFLAVEERFWRARSYGDFWMHMLVAEGSLDVAIEPYTKPWDTGPLQAIVEEAGGRVTDFSGAWPMRQENVISSNGYLHQEVLDLLADAPPTT